MARAIDADAFEKFLMNLPDEVLCEDCCYVVVNEMRNQPTIEPKQEWISVEDRLPEVGKKVLVCDVDAEPDVKHDINTFALECDENGYYWADEGGWWIDFENVSHWMPLPDPPENE